MCGIAGIARQGASGVTVRSLGRMAAAIKHRGPDGFGVYSGRKVGLTHVKLNVVDIGGGGQPLTNEDGQIVVTSTCEVFNHPELRHELEGRGHVFRTKCHAEVLVHGYEEWGAGLLQRLDGQFAFAIYDRNRETVFVARDRFGVRPLFYAQRNGDFYFASEIKAILATGEVDAALDPRGLDEVLRFGAARPPRTPFSGIAALEPGTYGIWKDGALWLRHYYELDYPERSDEPIDVIEQLDEIMLRSVGMRLRADVPVGAFLSGGLNSSITTSLARAASRHQLRSFSITYAIPEFDESRRQEAVAAAVGSVHTSRAIEMDIIAQSLPDVIWHAEAPLLRVAPALTFQLAKVAKESGVNVAIDGEGADEIFLGGDLFKEVSVRRFCLRRPGSRMRERLFGRIYPECAGDGCSSDPALRELLDAADPRDPLFSHLPRFLGLRLDDLYTAEFKAGLGGIDVIGELRASLPTRFFGWSPLNQAAYLEMTTRFSPYVLATHGDRMTAAQGVEARYPFLDHRLFEFAAALPTSSRLRGLREKEVLRRWASRILPAPARGEETPSHAVPDAQSFFRPGSPAWIEDHLSTEALRRVGIFSPAAVGRLVRRCHAGFTTSVADNQALVGVLSTQYWHHQFLERAVSTTPIPTSEAAVLLGDSSPISYPTSLRDPNPC
ncbi:MAG TPA: asparagine synthase (glutamine-hydrolyzing) [Gemmatimonadaceae bacterium]|nr:asparagine synthase (glutamine-hydrolyzing) [Gemmatimonadaceae bacterium]